ncbi:MAG: hypothetical protein JXR71_00435 [Bacteroidales bacterium]|nr:hypothetical protein [Bacteroidales bacterium]
MKKILFFALLLIFVFPVQTVLAQGSRNSEFSASYGVVSTDDLANIFGEIITSIAGYESKNATYTGIINAGYRNLINDRWLIGLTVSYEKSTADAYVQGSKIGTQKNTYYTVAAEANYQYVSGGFFQMYSGFGIGFTQASASLMRTDNNPDTNDKHNHINFQFTLAGFRVGKTIGLFGELGFGYKGIVNGGVSVRF